ncbi:hypothetical protein JJL56_31650 [Azospirillum sp. YIM DDC1]|uniref:Abi family protein n=1 Tax=Azospirillum aestuarii TaxID=2802052 RepID=A0ABS1I8L0_9PROT|nr:hypothetical protein [Azospirillum aestuarii]MBK4723408.1 hypothetical protein [Azospirillum aestuarii]
MYKWNARLAGTLIFPLHIAEVTLRNAVNQALIAEFGANWPNSVRLKAIPRSPSQQLNFVEKAVKKSVNRIQSEQKAVTLDQIIANMSFEFWVGMLHQDYEADIWDRHLRTVLPNLARHEGRADVALLAISVKSLRNRVSHHEPVFGASMDLTRKHSEILRLIRLRNKQTSYWVRDHSRVMSVLREKPVAPGAKPVGGAPLRGMAYKNIPVLPGDTPISLLITEIKAAEKYVLIQDDKGTDHVVGPSTVYAWLEHCAQQDDGLVDLTRTPASDLITAGMCLSHQYCVADISEWEATFIFEKQEKAGNPIDVLILTSNGQPGGAPQNLIGVADQALL